MKKWSKWDNYLFKATKEVWDELCKPECDCNPDLIPLALADACEIGFNKGFTAALVMVGAAGIGVFAGVKITKHFTKKAENK